jgi:ribulose-phosphate 3-epimerase
MNLYPSLLTDQEAVFKKQLSLVRDLPEIKTVQVDVIDGVFADNLTLMPIDLTIMDFGNKKLDFHLMSIEPLDLVLRLEELKDHLPIRAVIAQVERMSSQPDFIYEVKKQGWQVGLSLNLYSPVEAIDEVALENVDIVQVMAINAGFQGQKFNEHVLEVIKRLTDLKKEKDLKFEIIVDGGVKLSNVDQVLQAGADGVAVGSELWQAENIKQVVAEFIKK